MSESGKADGTSRQLGKTFQVTWCYKPQISYFKYFIGCRESFKTEQKNFRCEE